MQKGKNKNKGEIVMTMAFGLKGIDRKTHLLFVKYLKGQIKDGKSVFELESLIQYKAHELVPSLLQEGHNQRHVLKAIWRNKMLNKKTVKSK